MDLEDLEHNSRDGLHIASLAGAWMALVGGFGGMRTHGEGICFRPQLPPGIMRLSFRLRFRGRVLHVEVRSGTAKYSLVSGPDMDIAHYGDVVTIGDKPVSLDIPTLQPLPPPSQPPGRTPQSRRAQT